MKCLVILKRLKVWEIEAWTGRRRKVRATPRLWRDWTLLRECGISSALTATRCSTGPLTPRSTSIQSTVMLGKTHIIRPLRPGYTPLAPTPPKKKKTLVVLISFVHLFLPLRGPPTSIWFFILFVSSLSGKSRRFVCEVCSETRPTKAGLDRHIKKSNKNRNPVKVMVDLKDMEETNMVLKLKSYDFIMASSLYLLARRLPSNRQSYTLIRHFFSRYKCCYQISFCTENLTLCTVCFIKPYLLCNYRPNIKLRFAGPGR